MTEPKHAAAATPRRRGNTPIPSPASPRHSAAAAELGRHA